MLVRSCAAVLGRGGSTIFEESGFNDVEEVLSSWFSDGYLQLLSNGGLQDL